MTSSFREYPVTKMWYGKGAGRSIKEIIDWKPDYFIWLVEKFLDVTPSQAKYFSDKFGINLPLEVISPSWIVPFSPHMNKKDSPFQIEDIKQYLSPGSPDSAVPPYLYNSDSNGDVYKFLCEYYQTLKSC